MTTTRRPTGVFERVLGTVMTLAAAFTLGRMALPETDPALLWGIAAGVVFTLVWRRLHRAVAPRLDRWTEASRTTPGRVLAGLVSLPVPFLISPFGAALLLAGGRRFGLAALLLVWGECFLRAALGRPVGPWNR